MASLLCSISSVDAAAPAAEPAGRRHDGPGIEGLVLAVVGLLLCATGLRGALYDIAWWGPVGFGMLALVVLMVVRLPLRVPVAGLVGTGAICMLAVWALTSTAWAESSADAFTEAHRWAMAAALLTLGVVTVRGAPNRLLAVGWLLAGVTAGVLAVAAVITAKLLVGSGSELFVARRLFDPVGYANGQAGLLLLAFWPLVAAAERARTAALSGLALGGAAWLLALGMLTESRGGVLALAVSGALLLALVPGRRRRLAALLAMVPGLALAAGPLLGVFSESTAPVRPADVEDVGWWVVAAAAITSVTWIAAIAARRWLLRVAPSALALARRVAAVVALVASVAGLVVAASQASHISDAVAERVDAFRSLEQPEPGFRLLSSGGNRYDYWRVAVEEFRDEPLTGVGAGNYATRYFQLRRTSEDVRQPHSLELQVLAELGLVGLVLLVAAFIAVAGALWRISRDRAPGSVGLAVGAGGLVTGFLVQTSIDWLHLLPGVAGAAWLVAGALLGADPARSRVPRGLRGRLALSLAIVLAAAVAASGIARLTFAEHRREAARHALVKDPGRAIDLADDALALQRESLEALYTKAAAYARLGDYDAARATLLTATRYEPSNFVPYALLGDLATRRGVRRHAVAAYARASALNPRNAELRELARVAGERNGA